MNTTPLFKIVSICRGGGYRYCRTEPVHPKANANGLYPLHRVIAENKIGRLLLPGEIVHHVDEDRTNDSPDNLVVLTNEEHSRQHAIERAPRMVKVVCPCGKEFFLSPGVHRRQMKDFKSKRSHCSHSCAGRFARRAILPSPLQPKSETNDARTENP